MILRWTCFFKPWTNFTNIRTFWLIHDLHGFISFTSSVLICMCETSYRFALIPTSLAGGRRGSEVPCPAFDNNNQGPSDTHCVPGLDNGQAPEGQFAGEWHCLWWGLNTEQLNGNRLLTRAIQWRAYSTLYLGKRRHTAAWVSLIFAGLLLIACVHVFWGSVCMTELFCIHHKTNTNMLCCLLLSVVYITMIVIS